VPGQFGFKFLINGVENVMCL